MATKGRNGAWAWGLLVAILVLVLVSTAAFGVYWIFLRGKEESTSGTSSGSGGESYTDTMRRHAEEFVDLYLG